MRYPPARRLDLIEELHGFRVADPYRWLEDAESDETEAWAKALGLRTMWVNRRAVRPGGGGATPLPPGPVTPDGEVPTLAALADLHRRQQAR